MWTRRFKNGKLRKKNEKNLQLTNVTGVMWKTDDKNGAHHKLALKKKTDPPMDPTPAARA